MSTTIDERVVEMRFDNRQFEAGVKTSLSTLDKLKEGLDLDGAAKGLQGSCEPGSITITYFIWNPLIKRYGYLSPAIFERH